MIGFNNTLKKEGKTMRIFSKKAFQFDHPAGSAPAVTVQAGSFGDVPDWIADSIMFKLAKQDGDVEVIGSRQDEIAAETGTKAKAAAKTKADATSTDPGVPPGADPSSTDPQ